MAHIVALERRGVEIMHSKAGERAEKLMTDDEMQTMVYTTCAIATMLQKADPKIGLELAHDIAMKGIRNYLMSTQITRIIEAIELQNELIRGIKEILFIQT